jgi:hypothetical protein
MVFPQGVVSVKVTGYDVVVVVSTAKCGSAVVEELA